MLYCKLKVLHSSCERVPQINSVSVKIPIKVRLLMSRVRSRLRSSARSRGQTKGLLPGSRMTRRSDGGNDV